MTKIHQVAYIGLNQAGEPELCQADRALSSPRALPDYRIMLHMFPNRSQAMGYADGMFDSGTNVRKTTLPGGPNSTCLLVSYLDQRRPAGTTLDEVVGLKLHDMENIPNKVFQTIRAQEQREEKEVQVNRYLAEWHGLTDKIGTIEDENGRPIWSFNLKHENHKVSPILALQRFEENKLNNITIEKLDDRFVVKAKVNENFTSSFNFSRAMSDLAITEILEEVKILNNDKGVWSYNEVKQELQWVGEKEDLIVPLEDIKEITPRMTEICMNAKKAHQIAYVATSAYIDCLELIAEPENLIQGKGRAGPYWIVQDGVKTSSQIMSSMLHSMIQDELIITDGNNLTGETFKITERGLKAVFEGYKELATTLYAEFNFKAEPEPDAPRI